MFTYIHVYIYIYTRMTMYVYIHKYTHTYLPVYLKRHESALMLFKIHLQQEPPQNSTARKRMYLQQSPARSSRAKKSAIFPPIFPTKSPVFLCSSAISTALTPVGGMQVEHGCCAPTCLRTDFCICSAAEAKETKQEGGDWWS